jgi:hypothetical protein
MRQRIAVKTNCGDKEPKTRLLLRSKPDNMLRRTTFHFLGPFVVSVILLLLCSAGFLNVVQADEVGYSEQRLDRNVETQQEDELDNQNEHVGSFVDHLRYDHEQATVKRSFLNRDRDFVIYNRGEKQQYFINQQGDVLQEQHRRKMDEVAEEETDDGAVAEEEQQNDDASATDDAAVYNTFSVCSDAVIKVLDLSIYCDSPGTFYYGSGKYRNSASCLGGDKAKIQLDFYIAQPTVIESAGGYAILDITATGNSGWYQQNIKVFENADMCSTPTLKTLSKSTCPSQGKYRIKSHFYWPEDKYGGSSFYPSVMVGFKSSVRSNQYDYGGANTPYCRGSTFVTWTDGIRTIYANAIANFMKSFGILLLTIVLMGGFIWFLIKKPTSVRDAGQKLGVVKREVYFEDLFDFTTMRSPKNGQFLVDF